MLLLAAATVLALTGCAELAAFVAGEPQATDATDVGPSPGESLLPDATVTPSPPRTTQLERRFLVVPAPATLDVLIVVDNSMSMANVQQAFFEGRIVGSLANALRAPALGPDGSNKPCTSGDHSGCALPDLRVGVVSSDLGAPLGGLGNCSVGNGALLQSISRISSCLTPSAPWIAYNAAGLNVGGAQLDVVKALDEAIACIGTLGELGCGFEHTLEAMRRAIDPAFAINPGFLRPDATLAVILLTNEDDCSAADARLFDSSTNVLGPLTSHRCFANGFNCGDADLWSAGTKLGCRPAGPYLHEVRSRYVDFLQSLKPEGRLLLAAVAGAATARVEVVDSDLKATLAPACSGTITSAEPALRIRTLVDALAPDAQMLDICGTSKGDLSFIGNAVRSAPALSGICLHSPLLDKSGALLCAQGDTPTKGTSCQSSCLQAAQCNVVEIANPGTSAATQTPIPRCDTTAFGASGQSDCGATCPCWRIVSDPSTCSTAAPHYLQILRKTNSLSPGTFVKVSCIASAVPWGDPGLAALPLCP